MKSDSSFLMNHKILLPNRCREGLQGLKSPGFTGFFRHLELFPLDRGGRCGRNIIDDAVDALDLVDDANGDAVEHIIRDARPVGGHEVRRRDTAQRERIVIRAAGAHNTDRAHIRQHREVLVHRLLKVCLRDLVAEDEVPVTQNVDCLLYTSPRPRHCS